MSAAVAVISNGPACDDGPPCRRECEFGYAVGEDGCEICACLPNPCADFFYQTCDADNECPAAYVCEQQEGCVASNCVCDENGRIRCAEDCGMGGICVAREADLCADFHYQTCREDDDCDAGYLCGEDPPGCIPSRCGACDPETGRAVRCSADCQQDLRLCERADEADPCEGVQCRRGTRCVDGECVPALPPQPGN